METGELSAGEYPPMDLHPIKGGVEKLPVITLGSNVDLTFLLHSYMYM